ncbi:MAG: patatin-like phospholipase family protein [bacterium]|nr:patatin-like phospholipase family protein [bacterium]
MRQRPKIGLALSGASGRAIAHIGVLEVLREHGVPIDYISACSSGTVIAASYACGTLDMIKERLLKIDKQSFFQLLNLEKNGEGIFNLDKVEQEIKKYTLGKRFEDVRPMLNFVACDLDSGEGIGLTLGDLARACRISCSVPALFPPEHWGNKLLVDGGLFSLVPADQARGMGADIVIGVDIAATPYAFKESYVHVWRGYNYLKNSILLRPFRYIFNIFNNVYENSVKIIFYNQSDSLAEELNNNDLDLFTILGRAMKIASERHKNGKLPVCDIMLSPDVKHMGKVQLRKSKLMYYEGRRVALEAIPKIKKLIEDFKADHKLEAVLQNAERS